MRFDGGFEVEVERGGGVRMGMSMLRSGFKYTTLHYTTVKVMYMHMTLLLIQ